MYLLARFSIAANRRRSTPLPSFFLPVLAIAAVCADAERADDERGGVSTSDRFDRESVGHRSQLGALEGSGVVSKSNSTASGSAHGTRAIELRQASLRWSQSDVPSNLLEVNAESTASQRESQPTSASERMHEKIYKRRLKLTGAQMRQHAQHQLNYESLIQETRKLQNKLNHVSISGTVHIAGQAQRQSAKLHAALRKYSDNLNHVRIAGQGFVNRAYDFHKDVGKEVAGALHEGDFQGLEEELAKYYNRKGGDVHLHPLNLDYDINTERGVKKEDSSLQGASST